MTVDPKSGSPRQLGGSSRSLHLFTPTPIATLTRTGCNEEYHNTRNALLDVGLSECNAMPVVETPQDFLLERPRRLLPVNRLRWRLQILTYSPIW